MHIQLIIYALLVIFCVSCSDPEHQDQKMVNILSLRPKPPLICIESKQIVYNNRLDPEPISQDQLKSLSTLVCETKPNHVWFVRVLYNRKDTLRASIYFLPENSSGRIKKGKLTYYDSQYYTFPEDYITKKYINYNHDLKPEYYDYVQVLPELHSPVPGEIPYIAYMLPFSVSNNLTDLEIIEIVDFIRTGPILKKEDEGSINAYGEKPDPNIPIMSIKKVDGNIEVRMGTLEGPLSGSGQFLTIKKTDDEYELISIGMWVS